MMFIMELNQYWTDFSWTMTLFYF